MKKYSNVSISAAKEISKKYDKNQVIIVCWDNQYRKTHVTTYGKTVVDCDMAARGGNFVKRALGWPETLCNSEPSRVKKLKDRILFLEDKLNKTGRG